MSDIDQPGRFYLGREYDLEKNALTDRTVSYKSSHLTTHAVIVGMTGSGKTGLGIILLEEALLQGIPVLAVDPKGDLTNLLLTFPNLAPEDFVPWVDAERAQREGLSVEEVAAKTAQKWREGLSESGIGPERIARLREKADLALFTPGSTIGVPVDVLHRFQKPELDWEMHEEVLRERVGGLVTALLGLAGRETDPLQSAEHVLLSHIIEHVWREGQSVDLPSLIRMIQDPPIRQIGVFELESFLPQKDRVALARALNNIFASPGFSTWREGVPLDVESFMRAPDGRPRGSVFYLPHLNEAERGFFITMLLGAMREWMAAQSGTSDLRVVLYFDELFGFFPPHPANPPTKEPLMALIKQGRAVGLGVVLSTQNPVDLDYKGLTNAGTWVIGTLRTERDKDRVMEGIEGAASTSGGSFNRSDMRRALGTLKSRVFFLHNIRDDASCFFHTRWAMSYLPGPLTRAQVRQLVGETAPAAAAAAAAAAPAPASPAPAPEETLPEAPPTLSASIAQAFLPATVAAEWALHRHEERTGEQLLLTSKRLVYLPQLLALGTVYMIDQRKGINHQERVARLLDPPPPPSLIDWSAEGETPIVADDVSRQAVGEGGYLPVPGYLSDVKNYTNWSKAFSEHLYRDVRLQIFYNPQLSLYGKAGESRRDFRVRCEEAARDLRDAEIKKEEQKFETASQRLKDKLRREERELDADEAELTARKQEEVISGAESLFRLVSGRRSSSTLSTASRRRRMTTQAKSDVEESQATIEALEKQIADLQKDWEAQKEVIGARWAETLEKIESFDVAPRRQDVSVDFCGLVWMPLWEMETDAGRKLTLPAYEPKA
ncbi:MAG: DUF853 family protein [Anaerolineae bacterium]|nr:DUF853 family protein [Anaerolineae bacterium]